MVEVEPIDEDVKDDEIRSDTEKEVAKAVSKLCQSRLMRSRQLCSSSKPMRASLISHPNSGS